MPLNADAIRKAAADLGIPLSELARRANISPQHLNDALSGRVRDPRASLCQRLARCLGVPTDAILTEPED